MWGSEHMKCPPRKGLRQDIHQEAHIPMFDTVREMTRGVRTRYLCRFEVNENVMVLMN